MASSMPPGPRELVAYWGIREPQRPAVMTRDGGITYGEAAGRATELASSLRRFGIASRVQVALAFPNSVDYLIWLAAIFMTGAVAVPLSPNVSEAEVNQLALSAEIGFVACSAGARIANDPAWQPAMTDDAGNHLLRHSGPHESPALPEGALVRHFSSGSTGRPKHIVHSEAQVSQDYRQIAAVLKLDGSARYLALAPFHHSFGAAGLYAVLAQGGVIRPVAGFIPAQVMATARVFRPTLTLVTPPMIEMLGKCHLTEPDHEVFSTLKHCVCSTGRLGATAAATFRQRFGVAVQVQYGSTETLSATIDLNAEFQEGRVGHVYPGVEIAVFDEVGRVLPPGATGRIGIRSRATCTGYADEDHTLEVIDGYVLPGDKGCLDKAGALYIAGRDNVYNLGGYKVDRCEIESLIRCSLPVSYVAAMPFLRAGQPAIHVLIEADPGEVTAAGVVALCSRHLLPYKVPARVDIRAVLPRDENGKVRMASLVAPGTGS